MTKRQTTNVKRLTSTIDIDHTAKLANLDLSPAEMKTFDAQLGKVLDYINKLNEVDTKDVLPIDQITSVQNVTREDMPTPSLSQDDALKNAPRTYNGFFEVDAVFEKNNPE